MRWTFVPSHLFDKPETITVEGVDVAIDKGQAVAQFTDDRRDDDSLIRTLADGLDRYLRARAAAARKAAQLEPEPTINFTDDSGRVSTILRARGAARFKLGGHGAIVGLDGHGNVIRNPDDERRARQEARSNRYLQWVGQDSVFDKMLSSLDRAAREPDQTLWRLYEITDALRAEFKGDSKVATALRISTVKDDLTSPWGRLGALANNRDLIEGRHHGKAGTPRQATDAERRSAWEDAEALIDLYLDYRKANP